MTALASTALRPLDFSRARVLVVGDVMLDRYWHGATSRISPEAPVPVVHVQQDECRVGGAGNVAVNVAALGAEVALVGLVGQDEAAGLLRERLAAAGVADRLVGLDAGRTISKLRILSRHQQLIRLDFEDVFAPSTRAALLEQVRAQLPGHAALVLSDYAKGTLAGAAELIALAREAGIPVIVDPKGTDFTRYRGATVLTPNLHEFEAVAGPCADEASLIERGEALRDALELQALLITRSERGMLLLERGRPRWRCPPGRARSTTSPAPGTRWSPCWPRAWRKACAWPRPRRWPTWPPASWWANSAPPPSASTNCSAPCTNTPRCPPA